MSRRSLVVLVLFAAVLGGPAVAQAAPGGVAYLKDREVWVAKLDGSKKVRLSGGEGDWNAVGQSASGAIVATRNEAGRTFQSSQFKIWNAAGSEKDAGPASPGLNYTESLTFPLGLELDTTNGLIVYGYSYRYVSNYSTLPWTYAFEQGYALMPSATRVTPALGVVTESAVRWPTIAGERIIGTSDGHIVSVQDAGGYGTQTYTPWFTTSGIADSSVHGSHASDDGRVAAVEVDIDAAGTDNDTGKIAMLPFPALGEALQPGDCFLATDGRASGADVSADGAIVAWADLGGVKVAGKPDFSGAEPCALTGAPTVIEAGASEPALGPIDVDALYAARNAPPPATNTTPTETTTTPTTPTVAVPAPGKAPTALVPQGLTAATLLGTQGSSIQVGTGKAGKITVTVKVKASTVGRRGAQIVIATGSARAAKAGGFTVKLKPTKLGKKFKKKLRGKKVTVIISAGGKTTTKTVTLK